jgi:hypothetical protein
MDFYIFYFSGLCVTLPYRTLQQMKTTVLTSYDFIGRFWSAVALAAALTNEIFS